MTTELARATLTRLKQIPAKGKNGKPSYEVDPKGTYEVQFNPTTLKITRSNNIDKGGATTNTQKRQMPSVQPATLSFDLEFDTAEGDGQGRPKDVRDLTRIVRQFTEPTREKPKDPPPAVEFAWGTFRFKGIVTQLTEDLDYFSPDGLPLRAKLSLTITEQNPDWEASAIGPGARTAGAAAPGASRPTAPGGAGVPSPVPGSGPGSQATPNPVLTALARAGESVQQLLSRLDADPATWRSAMAGLDSPLALTAGTQVQLGAAVSASAGLGAGVGVAASVGGGFTAAAGVNDVARARAALGIAGSASLGRGAGAEATAGFVLAEAGGLGAASARVEAVGAASAQAGARASFAVPDVSATASARADAVFTVDPRSRSYGRGIPLRARVRGDAAATQER